MRKTIVAVGLISTLSLAAMAEDGKGFDITEGTPTSQKGATGREAKVLLDNAAKEVVKEEVDAKGEEKAAVKDAFPADKAKDAENAGLAVKKEEADAKGEEKAAVKDAFPADKGKDAENAGLEVKKDEKRASGLERRAVGDVFPAAKAKVMLDADKAVKKDEKRAIKKENDVRTLEMLDLD